MCEIQKYIPLTFFNVQQYQVKDIEICGPVDTCPMWMVERHLKSLKDLVRQRACSEGSMVEGYMVYQSMMYVC